MDMGSASFIHVIINAKQSITIYCCLIIPPVISDQVVAANPRPRKGQPGSSVKWSKTRLLLQSGQPSHQEDEMDKYPQVLIIDDSEDDTRLLLEELCKNGYEPHHERVDSAESMKRALAEKKWDIVLSDCVMFNFSGTSALEILKENDLDLPFILVSRKIDEETAVQLMRVGAHDYFEKGSLKRLVPAIERELHKAEERHRGKKAEELLRKSEERFRLITE